MLIVGIIVGSLLILFLLSHFVIIFQIFKAFFCRYSDKHLEERLKNDPNYSEYLNDIYRLKSVLENREHEIISVKSNDGLILKGRYYNNHSKNLVIFFHGVHVNPLNNFAAAATKFLEQGYSVLIIYQRAHGLSEGKYITYGKYEQEDVLKWVDYFSDKQEIENIYLYGASMGGTSLCLASQNITSNKVKGLIIDSAYCTFRSLIDNIIAVQHVPAFLFLGGIKFLAKHLAKVNFDDFDTRNALKSNHIPALFIYGTKDIVVAKENFVDNYNACASSKEEMVVEGAPHILALAKGGEEAYQKLFNFIKGSE